MKYDRRSGYDRRRKQDGFSLRLLVGSGKIIRTERRFELGDRRRLNTYIADDRRVGLADRRDHIRFLQYRSNLEI